MSIAAPRWVGVAGLLGLLAGAIVLMAAPGNPGALRLSGVSLLWWYTAVVAPLGAVLLIGLVQRVPAEIAGGTSGWSVAAAWTSPVVLGLVAAGVFSGAPGAPAFGFGGSSSPSAQTFLAGFGKPPVRIASSTAAAPSSVNR